MGGLTEKYQSALDLSKRLAWNEGEPVQPLDRLDFDRNFLPEWIAQTEELSVLNANERKLLNQIRGHSYAHIFWFVEEYIVGFPLMADRRFDAEPTRQAAMSLFAEEECKHRRVFRRLKDAFKADFGSQCFVIDSSADTARSILSHHPLTVALLTLHLELTTQWHYRAAFSSDQALLDPIFCRVFQYHAIEEAQHALLDTLEIHRIEQIERVRERLLAVAEYRALLDGFSKLLDNQAYMDLASLELAINRRLAPDVYEHVLSAQKQAYRRAFLDCGEREMRARELG